MSGKRKHTDSDVSNDEMDTSEVNYMSDEEGGIRIDDIYIPPPPRPPGTIEAGGPRLIITKIVNTNFKSYGGVRVLGPFHKNFNAIVGPNGSGKSNVIDSMLFVFGYRASKIRSKKLSVLLHKSSAYPNVQLCSVGIHFGLINDTNTESDSFEIIPGSEFIISRTAHKDNSSYYELNNKKVQRKEIASLLRKHGVDLDHNRFLILQGEVEQISLMKPKAQNEHDTGMLEYLEDVIGTTRYKDPLKKLDEKIELLSDLRTEKLNRVKLAEKERDDFKEPMLEAVKFLELENEIIKKKNFLYQRQIKQTEMKVSEIEENNSVLQEKEIEMKEKVDSLATEKKSRENAFKEISKKFDSLSKRKEHLQEAFDQANNRDVTIVAEMEELNKRRKKVIDILKTEKNKLETYEKTPAENQRKIDEYEVREKQLATENEKLKTDKSNLLAVVNKETSSLQEKKKDIQTKLIDLRAVVDDTKAAFNLAESELKVFVSNEESQRKKLETLKTSYEENGTKLQENSRTLKELNQKLPNIEKQYKNTLANLDRFKIEEPKLRLTITTKRAEVEEIKSSMQASRSQNRVLDALTQLKNNGDLPGLFGRLGDLGAVDQKYDIAMSTACGPLDNLVVDTVDTAQYCIEYLKQHNIGRATFIALEKQEHLRELANTKINTPENVSRLFDLIRVEDAKVRTAFYYGLRDTLVANDIDQATRIAYGAKRFRVVSLKGDLIEVSGTMSGGGKQVHKGRIKITNLNQEKYLALSQMKSPQKMKDLETSLSQLEEKLRELRQRQIELEDEVNKLQGELRVMNTEKEKLNTEIHSLQQIQPGLQVQLRQQEQKVKECKSNPAQVKKLEAVIAQKREAYEKANNKSEELQHKVDQINQEIEEKTDAKMSGINRKIKEASNVWEKMKAELVKLRVAIKTAQRNQKQCREKIGNLEQEKSEAEKKLMAMKKEREEIEQDATTMIQHIKKIEGELAEEEKAFSAERNEISDLAKELTKLRSEKVELDQKISDYNKTIKENRNIIRHIQSKLNDLQLHEIPEVEPEQLRKYNEQELLETDTKQMEKELKREEDEIRRAKPNLTAITDYIKKVQIYIERANELDDITKKRTQMRELREDVAKKRQTEFHAGFNLISSKMKEMYQLITLGGDAELEMVDSYDPFSEGIVLNVRPPLKSWKNITNLSGGEKTLSSLSLVFALHYYKPSPLYFMDEIDAALDFKNVSIIGNYIQQRTKNAQFIIISLRSNMFELADHLVGIYKVFDITNSVTFNPKQYEINNDVARPNASQRSTNNGNEIDTRNNEDNEIDRSNSEANEMNDSNRENVEYNSEPLFDSDFAEINSQN